MSLSTLLTKLAQALLLIIAIANIIVASYFGTLGAVADVVFSFLIVLLITLSIWMLEKSIKKEKEINELLQNIDKKVKEHNLRHASFKDYIKNKK